MMNKTNHKINIITIIIALILLLTINNAQGIDYNFINFNYYKDYSSNTLNNAFIGYDGNNLIIGNINGTFREVYSNNGSIKGYLINQSFSTINGSLNIEYASKSITTNNIVKYTTSGNVKSCNVYNSSGTNVFSLADNIAGNKHICVLLENSSNSDLILISNLGRLKTLQMNNGNGEFFDCHSTLKTLTPQNITLSHPLEFLFIDYNTNTLILKQDDNYFSLPRYSYTNCSTVQLIPINPVILDNNHNFTYGLVTNNTILYGVNNESALLLGTSNNIDIYSGLVCGSPSNCVSNSSYCVGNQNGLDYACKNSLWTGGGFGQFICNTTNDAFPCTLSCNNVVKINIYGVQYSEGVCLNDTTCSNDCIIVGSTISDSLTTYQRCIQNPNTNCLSYSAPISCGSGNISIDGLCQQLNNNATTTTQRGFSVIPSYNGFQTSNNFNSNPRKADYETNKTFLNLNFDSISDVIPYYLSRTCNYTNTIIYSNGTNTNYQRQDGNLSIITPSYTDGILSMDIIPDIDTGVLVETYDILGREIYKYYILRNSSIGTCIYLANSSMNQSRLLGCSINSGDLVQSMLVEIQTLALDSSLHLRVQRSNTFTDNFYSSFDNKINPSGSGINLFVITGNLSNRITTINNDVQASQIKYKNINTTLSNTSNTCQFNTVGCRIVRSYYVNIGQENLFNYRDWNICVDRLGNSKITTDGKGFLSSFNDTAKLILAIATSFIVFIIMLVIGITRDDESTQKGIIWIGIVLSILTLFVFIIVGWIDIIVIIIALILASLGVVGFFINKSQGG